MTHTPPFLELTDHELTSVAGGFLPLLGMLGMGANLAGSIMGGIGKKKAQEAQQLTAAAGGQGQPAGQGTAPATTSAANNDLLAQRAPATSSCSDCGCGASSSSSSS